MLQELLKTPIRKRKHSTSVAFIIISYYYHYCFYFASCVKFIKQEIKWIKLPEMICLCCLVCVPWRTPHSLMKTFKISIKFRANFFHWQIITNIFSSLCQYQYIFSLFRVVFCFSQLLLCCFLSTVRFQSQLLCWNVVGFFIAVHIVYLNATHPWNQRQNRTSNLPQTPFSFWINKPSWSTMLKNSWWV